jgi:biopolymer transport protein ExbD
MNPTTGGWRRRDARTAYDLHHGPNMTPMVDVVMVILIFFMASTVILGTEMLLAAGLEPEAPPATEPDPRFAIQRPVFEIAITVTDSGPAVNGLGLASAPISALGPVARAFAADAGAGSVRMVIVPDNTVPYEAVVRVQDILRDAGLGSIGLR